MRRHPRLDSNHRAIVEGLRKLGYSVQSLAMVGAGCPDIVVGAHGRNWLFEIKPPGPPSRQGLTSAEQGWHYVWHGQVHVVSSVEDVVEVIICETAGMDVETVRSGEISNEEMGRLVKTGKLMMIGGK